MIFKIFLLLFSFATYAREVPNLSGPVVDEANLLSKTAKNSLESFLYNYKEQTGNQVQVLIIDSLEGDVLENFSIKVSDSWKLGDEKKDNGLLFLVALKERKMRIEVGQGLEGDLPDVLAGRIIEGVKPYFKSGKYEEGVFFGVELITRALKGDTKAIPTRPKRQLSLIHLIIFIIFIIWIVLNKFFWFLPFMGGHRSSGGFSTRGGGFGGGFGGGGWSGGGGGFSGGGSSGNW